MVLESAIIFMVAIFAFCLLLSSLTLTGYNQVKIEKIKAKNDLNLDLVAEDYLAYVNIAMQVYAKGGGAQGAGVDNSEINEGEQAPDGSVPAPPITITFASYLEGLSEENKRASYDTEIYEYNSTVTPGEPGNLMFLLEITNKASDKVILSMTVYSRITSFESSITTETEILSFKKS